MKQRFTAILFIVACILTAGIIAVFHNNRKLYKELAVSKTNELAYIAERDNLKNKSIEFQYTISQLKNNNDSIVKEMRKVQKELNVKDKQLAHLSYLLSEAQIKDSLIVRDTIFVKDTKIDTMLNNKWYNISLGLEYPNNIKFDIKVPSEKYVVSSYKKVILEPSDCWFVNLFKKKTGIVEVEVLEKNPYIENKQQKFIDILK